MNERLELSSAEQVKAALHPIRQQILSSLRQHEKATPSEVARDINLPANKVHYHMNILESAGLVTLVETRKVGSITEKYFSAVAAEFTIDARAHVEYFDAAMPPIQDELKALLSDLRDLSAEGRTHPLFKHGMLAVLRTAMSEKGEETVTDAIQKLQARVDLARESNPDQEYRLFIGWGPVNPLNKKEDD